VKQKAGGGQATNEARVLEKTLEGSVRSGQTGEEMLETGQNLNTPDVGRSLFPANNDAMVHHLVDHLDGWSRNALLGISNSIMLAEITANRMLDQIDPPA
jgi:hypothetical protein